MIRLSVECKLLCSLFSQTGCNNRSPTSLTAIYPMKLLTSCFMPQKVDYLVDGITIPAKKEKKSTPIKKYIYYSPMVLISNGESDMAGNSLRTLLTFGEGLTS